MIGSRDVHLRKLIRRQALHAFDLRNDLVAASLNAEPVDVVAANQRRQILAGIPQVNALCSQLVSIEHNFGLRLIELEIRISENEEAARERLLHQLSSEVDKLPRLSG